MSYSVFKSITEALRELRNEGKLGKTDCALIIKALIETPKKKESENENT